MFKKFPVLLVVVALALAALGCNFTSTSGLPPVGEVPSNTPGAGSTVEIVSVSTVQSVSPTPEPTQTARVETQVVVVTATSEPTKAPTKAALVAQNDLASTPEPTEVITDTQNVTATTQVSATSLITYTVVDTESVNGWDVSWLEPSEFDRGDGTTFKEDAEDWDLRELAPELWPTFPNVPNPLVSDFKVVTCADDPSAKCVPDGVEYANAESNFCQQLAGEACRVPVAARHYLYFSGDYDIPGIGQCSENGTGIGCLLIVDNVGEVTADITGIFQQGFRLHARYWNGDELDMAMWALASHGVNVMTNMNSRLNPDDFANAGANCSVPSGCGGVHVQWVVITGNVPMMNAEATYLRSTGSYVWDWLGRRFNDVQGFFLN